MKKICGIYKITSPSGRIYIGQGVNIIKRFRTYKNLHCKLQPRLYNSLIKYGWKNHIFEIVKECTKEKLDCEERYLQDFYDVLSSNGLNCQLTACGELNAIISEEKRKKLSYSHIGIKPSEKSTRIFLEYLKTRIISEEERKAISIRMSGSSHHFYDKYLSKEHKDKISIGNKGKNKGKIYSDEHRKNLSKSHIGLYKDEKHPLAKLVLCQETGIFYFTLKSAAIAYGIKYTTLCAMMKGQNPNITSLIYC